ncbi:MAG TPA: DUF3341 domain-containing protein [Pyrinomonadaceae bacterium]|nr:DUF3341 domain-containing protein [Pyrinomonadaceae bacterium]
MKQAPLYGVAAEFDDPTAIVAAARRLADEGYMKFEAYTPFHIEELSGAIPVRRPLLPLIVLAGGVVGAVGGFFMLYYATVIGYPLNIGGRPPDSWPMYIPITFELTVLFAALFAVFGVLALCRLPMPYHPLFGVESFARASQDRFFLCVEADDPKFDRQETANLLRSMNALEVNDVFD